MKYHVVTYDLAVAMKAYAIQNLHAPLYDNLIILLGHFHVELAFFGAMGTYISDSGLQYLLTESGILAEGSLTGFLKGKLYNRCTRVHQIAALALEKTLFERFQATECGDKHEIVIETIRNLPSLTDHKDYTQVAESQEFKDLLDNYEAFFQRTMKGDLGDTAAFWAVYVYLINRLYRHAQLAIRTNDAELYIQLLPALIEVFFALNRPNYSRWGSLLEKSKTLSPAAMDVLKAGAFTTQRTNKSYSRCPIDLTLEQTVNRDASSSATGIVHFSNSESAFRRWCMNLTQRSMVVPELKNMCGIEVGETPANHPGRGSYLRQVSLH